MGGNIITGPEVGFWVADRVGVGYLPERSAAIGLESNGKIVAGVIYESFNYQSIWCHMAIEGRMTPAFLAAIFDYAYKVADVEKVILPVGSNNPKVLRFIKNLGFEEEGCIKNGLPGGDILFYTQRRENCRFLTDRYRERLFDGQECITAPGP